jgi:hypothetical protein
MRIRYSLVTAAVASLIPIMAPTVASASTAAPARWHQIGTCTARGDFAICVASGNVNHPLQIQAYVIARPGQRVSGAWDMVCSKGSGAGSKSGNIGGRASAAHPLVKTLPMPYRRPDSCTVSADAQLQAGGNFIRVGLKART